MATKGRKKPAGRSGADELLIAKLAMGMTIQAAALEVGISERTAHRRLEEPAFRARVNAARSEMVRNTIGSLAAVGQLAVARLHRLLEDPSSSVCLGAARTLLDAMFRGHEHEILEQRIAELERRLNEGDGP
jgi:hypothetical protein